MPKSKTPADEIKLSSFGAKVVKILKKSAEVFAERNAVYKDNFAMVGKIMAALHPNGLTLKTEEDFNKFHLHMLSVVKMTRYASNYEDGHEDSIKDQIVYEAMVAAIDEEKKDG